MSICLKNEQLKMGKNNVKIGLKMKRAYAHLLYTRYPIVARRAWQLPAA